MRIGGWQQAADGRPGVAPWSLWMDLSGDAELVLSSTSLLLAGFSGRCRNCTSPLPAISSAIACCETRICSSDGIVCVCVCVCVSVARRTSPFTFDCKNSVFHPRQRPVIFPVLSLRTLVPLRMMPELGSPSDAS